MPNTKLYFPDFSLEDIQDNFVYSIPKINNKQDTNISQEIEKKTTKSEEIENIRDYNLDFNIKLLYAKSIATEELSKSKASSYLEFMPINNNGRYKIKSNNNSVI